jgi:hypothetical protein
VSSQWGSLHISMNDRGKIRYYLACFCAIFWVFFLLSSDSFAGWLIYHKPEFKGRVIDAKTKEPIEGAVVVVAYYKKTFGWPAGGYISVIRAKETLTDKKGEFYFPSYTTLIQPLAVEYAAKFIIYKPLYGNFPDQQIWPSGLTSADQQIFFSKETGSTGELMMWEKGEKGPEIKKSKVIFGVVELRNLKTRAERLKASSIDITGYTTKKLPLLFKALGEEDKALGVE